MVHNMIQKGHSMNRQKLLIKPEKQDNDDSFILVLAYHPALKKIHEILKKAYRDSIRSPRLIVVLPSPPRVVFRNSKALKDHLIRSKLKIRDSKVL